VEAVAKDDQLKPEYWGEGMLPFQMETGAGD
jgi:hypothetical protein